MLTINKQFDKFKKGEWSDEGYNYMIKYISDQYVFIDNKKIKEENSDYTNILNLTDKNFLEEHNIEYVIDKNNEVIPVGIINFINNDKTEEIYNKCFLKLICKDETKLYRCNKIIENIDKAIKMQYEAVKFVEKIDKTEAIELI